MLELLSTAWNISRTRGIPLGPGEYPSDPWNIPRARLISLGPV